jgi:hypothetical protein
LMHSCTAVDAKKHRAQLSLDAAPFRIAVVTD